jgi:hypothetical protein
VLWMAVLIATSDAMKPIDYIGWGRYEMRR